MSQTHYKLPINTEVDKDILDWINSFPRNKKGEMVRHAIRYYMSVVGGDDSPIQFPSNPNQPVKKDSNVIDQATKNKQERKRPQFNLDLK